MRTGDTSIMMQNMHINGGSNGDEYINQLYNSYRDDESAYAESRASRIRAALFGDEPSSSNDDSRFGLVNRLAEPAQMVRAAVVELLRLQADQDMRAQTVPDLVRLMCDHDEAVVARAVQRVYVMSKEDRSMAVAHPQLIETLIRISHSDNISVKRDAMGALAHLSENKEARMHLFRSGGLAELIKMLYCPIEVVVHYAVTTLHNLLLHVDQVKGQARALGALEALAPLLLRSNHRLLALVADSLYLLLLDDFQSKITFLSLGGPQTLVHILKNHSQYRKLIYTVIRCIRSLSTCEENKAALISLGAIPLLFAELTRTPLDDQRMRQALLLSLRNLSNAAANEDNLTDLVVYLLDVIRNADEATTTCACGILSNLTCNNIRNKQTVCATRGVEALTLAIANWPEVEDATEPALCTLRHCTARHSLAEQAQNDLRLCGTFPQLLSLMSTLRAPVVKAALGVIRNSALLSANIVELTHERTAEGDTIVSLSAEILKRAAFSVRDDRFAEADGVPMMGVVEGAVAALHQLATDQQVAASLLATPGLLPVLVELLGRSDVSHSEDETLEREVLGLLYQLSKGPEGARAVEAAGPTPLLVDALRSEHRSVSTYASGVLKNLDADKPAAYRHDLDMESSTGWQRDGIEPELFGEMYASHQGLNQLDHSAGYPISHNNSSWFDTDL